MRIALLFQPIRNPPRPRFLPDRGLAIDQQCDAFPCCGATVLARRSPQPGHAALALPRRGDGRRGRYSTVCESASGRTCPVELLPASGVMQTTCRVSSTATLPRLPLALLHALPTRTGDVQLRGNRQHIGAWSSVFTTTGDHRSSRTSRPSIGTINPRCVPRLAPGGLQPRRPSRCSSHRD